MSEQGKPETKKKTTWKLRVFAVLELGGETYRLGRWFDMFMISLIFLNVAVLVMETVQSINARWGGAMAIFDKVSVLIFTLEYLARIWTCTEFEDYKDPILGRLRYALRPMLLIDLLAILPFFLPFATADLRFIRVFRFFKMARYSRSMQRILEVVMDKRKDLTIALFSVFVLLIFSSSFVYMVEHKAQPDKFSSIPAAMWWGVATLTTVGYGDIYPVTPLGKLIGALIAMLGVGIFAVPAAMLASGFYGAQREEEKEEEREKRRRRIAKRMTKEAGDLAPQDDHRPIRAEDAEREVEVARSHLHAHVHLCPHCGQSMPTHPTKKSQELD